MRVKIGWGSDDTKTESKEFESTQDMLDYVFNIQDRIILHKLSKNLQDENHGEDKEGKHYDYFVMIYDDKVL
ncbi:MAG: hypothetical protein ACR2F1_06610 [Nitrososphaeraceae archaeon]